MGDLQHLDDSRQFQALAGPPAVQDVAADDLFVLFEEVEVAVAAVGEDRHDDPFADPRREIEENAQRAFEAYERMGLGRPGSRGHEEEVTALLPDLVEKEQTAGRHQRLHLAEPDRPPLEEAPAGLMILSGMLLNEVEWARRAPIRPASRSINGTRSPKKPPSSPLKMRPSASA